MKNYVLTLFFLLLFNCLLSQTVGINSTGAVPATSAMLDVASTNKGLLIPRVDIIDLSTPVPVAAPVTSLLVYNTNIVSGIGYYYWNGTSWIQLLDVSSTVDDHDWYKETTTTAPTAITDDIFTEGKVRISTPNYPPLMVERTSTVTNGIAGVIRAKKSTSVDMIDGFGTRLDFAIEDNSGVDNEIAHIGAVRDGADNSGRLQLWTENLGVDGVRMVIEPDGDIGIGVVTPLERLDVNGDIYLRGDDMYFSHDGAGNINNDYVRFDDVNSLNFGGGSIFSFHADRPRGEDWTTPTGSISFDGAYATGKIGMNTITPQASLDIVNGYAISDRFWYKDYVVNTANPAIVLGRDGNALPTNFVGMLFCAVTGTDANGTSYWMVKRYNNGTVRIERIASFNSTVSNTPEIYDDGGVIKIRLYNHTVNYTVRVRTEQMW